MQEGAIAGSAQIVAVGGAGVVVHFEADCLEALGLEAELQDPYDLRLVVHDQHARSGGNRAVHHIR